MSRPRHLNVPMTPEIIRHINSEQQIYDRDPEAYEREEKRREERYREEQEREYYERRIQNEK